MWNWVTYCCDFSLVLWKFTNAPQKWLIWTLWYHTPTGNNGLKSMKAFFFFRCGFCLLCLCKLWFHESKETIMFSISKVPEKTNWEAASSLPPGFKAGHFSKKVDNTAGVYGADRQVDGVVELSLWITASTIGEWPDSPWLWSHLCQVQVHRRAGKDPGLKHWLQCRIPPLLFLSRKETMQK